MNKRALIFIFSAQISFLISSVTSTFEMDNDINLMDNFEPDRQSCSNNPEVDMTTIEVIKKSGYPAEEHFVTTPDGYILALHRIPGPKGSPSVLLQHPLLESSFCWVVAGRKKGLAYILADNGYDVWMGNVRGNTYSKNHSTLSPTDPAFWNFSWHEMGIYDLPAEIDYITSLKNDSLAGYVGHSMGTTVFFVMASERPEIASKVKMMFALGPAAYVDHIKGPFRALALFMKRLQVANNLTGNNEFFSQNVLFKYTAKCICNRPGFREFCRDVIFSVVGFNPQQFNTSMLPLIISHTPAGTSLKTIFHYSQEIKLKKFSKYDYGAKINLKIYNNTIPPEYNISRIQVPIALFYGQNDFLTPPQDVIRLYEKLPNKIGKYLMEDPNFNHLDFIWGMDAPKLVYSKILALMKKK